MQANIFLNCLYLTLCIVLKDSDAVQNKLKNDTVEVTAGNSAATGKISQRSKSIVQHHDLSSGSVNIPLNSANGEINIPMEGGDVPFTKVNTAGNPATISDESDLSTGSKGRKGVGKPGQIVPRKGVNPSDKLETKELNVTVSKSLEHQVTENITTFINKTVVSSNDSHEVLNNRTFEIKKKISTIHIKKPEVVSDKDVPDDFDKYSMIKTSTTGEDYVIIGIVIVIGIWFSVFGALIFYRRAGEYWDRRHYRRMDFLVEGMYND